VAAVAAKSRVLVVEDDADLRQAICQILEEEGYRVRTASNGQEALGILELESEPCLILLDLMMPVMDGWQFLERKNRDQRFGGYPVIVVSAYLEQPQLGSPAFAAPHLKVDGVLRKPLDLHELVEAVSHRCP
jgi:CheY-like chemotaxis protein